MASGVKITDEVKEAYQSVSMTTSKKCKLKFAVFKFSDKNDKIVVDQTKEQTDDDNDYDTLIQSLPKNDVRYIAYDMEYCNKDGTEKSDVVFISWHPNDSPIKKKMVCASSLNALKASLSVSKNIIEADDCSEADSSAVLEKLHGTAIKKKGAVKQ